MSKTVVIHQPDFIPYLGFFHRFLSADLYIVLDHVQFVHHTKHSWTHRDKIKTRQGERWLSVSVNKAPMDTPINCIELSSSVDWRQANLRVIEENYKTAPYYSEIMPVVKQFYDQTIERLVEFNFASIKMLMDLLDVNIPCIFSSSLNPVGKKNEMLLDLLGKVGATHYLTGVGSRDYLDEAAFATNSIKVIWQQFQHPIYPQQFGEFISSLSALDLLFNCGVPTSRRILRGVE
jgi:hypothetical protein